MIKSKKPNSLDIVKQITEEITNIEDISNKSRKTKYVLARWLYIKLAKEFTDNTLDYIGNVINRDHSTVVHAIKSMEFDFAYNKDLQTKYEEAAIILTNKLQTNAIEQIDERIDFFRNKIIELQKRKKRLIDYELINSEFKNKEDRFVFWS